MEDSTREAVCLPSNETSAQTKSLPPSRVNNLSLVVLMGLPASGKSTLANMLVQFNSTSWLTVVISFDNFIPLNVQAELSAKCSEENAKDDLEDKESQVRHAKMLRKKFVQCVESVVRFVKEVDKDERSSKVSNYLQALSEVLKSYEANDFVSDESYLSKVEDVMKTIADNGHDKIVMVVDDNNYYQSMRNDFYQVAKQLEVGFCLVFCNSSLKTCVSRNSSRPVELQVPQKVIVEMSLKFEAPDPLRNAADMYCIEMDMNDQSEVNLQLLESVVQNSICNPLKKNDDRTDEIERERRICSESEIHQADLVLRKWIGKKLNLMSISNGLSKNSVNDLETRGTGNFKKNLSKELTEKKKVTLEKLRCGELKISFKLEQDVEFQGEIIKLFEGMIIE